LEDEENLISKVIKPKPLFMAEYRNKYFKEIWGKSEPVSLIKLRLIKMIILILIYSYTGVRIAAILTIKYKI